MRRPSEGPIFRALTGIEMRQILLDDILSLFSSETFLNSIREACEKEMDSTNRFMIGDSYPVVRVTGQLDVKVMPHQKLPLAIPIYVKFSYGTSLDTALDKVREAHDMEVLQARKTKSGLIVNLPVEEKDARES